MIVCVTGGKGGPGATVLAANLAVAVARTGKRCLLVDLDPFGGDLGAYLGPERLDPRRGLLPLLKIERADVAPEAIERESQEVTSGLMVLLGGLRPAADLLVGRTTDVLRSADRVADFVVADLGQTLRSPALDGLSQARIVFLAARADLQGALAAERALSLIGKQAPVRIVATRVRRRRMADVTELAEALGRPVAASMPELKVPVRVNQHRRLRRALNQLTAEFERALAVTESGRGELQEVVA